MLGHWLSLYTFERGCVLYETQPVKLRLVGTLKRLCFGQGKNNQTSSYSTEYLVRIKCAQRCAQLTDRGSVLYKHEVIRPRSLKL